MYEDDWHDDHRPTYYYNNNTDALSFVLGALAGAMFTNQYGTAYQEKTTTYYGYGTSPTTIIWSRTQPPTSGVTRCQQIVAQALQKRYPYGSIKVFGGMRRGNATANGWAFHYQCEVGRVYIW